MIVNHARTNVGCINMKNPKYMGIYVWVLHKTIHITSMISQEHDVAVWCRWVDNVLCLVDVIRCVIETHQVVFIKAVACNVNLFFQRDQAQDVTRNGILREVKSVLSNQDLFDFRKQKILELRKKILLFEAGKPYSCCNEGRLTLMDGSSEYLHKNIIIFSRELWDLPMWKWTSGVVATPSSMLVPKDDGLFKLRMWHTRASQCSMLAICFTNCFPSVQWYLALEVWCSSSPCIM